MPAQPRDRSTPKEPGQEPRARSLLVMTRAPTPGGHGTLDVGNVLTTSSPGGLPARRARHSSAHRRPFLVASSGEAEEELLEFFGCHAIGAALGVGNAILHGTGDNRESCTIQSGRDRSELGDNVSTRTTGLDSGYHRIKLATRSTEAIEYAALSVAISGRHSNYSHRANEQDRSTAAVNGAITAYTPAGICFPRPTAGISSAPR